MPVRGSDGDSSVAQTSEGGPEGGGEEGRNGRGKMGGRKRCQRSASHEQLCALLSPPHNSNASAFGSPAAVTSSQPGRSLKGSLTFKAPDDLLPYLSPPDDVSHLPAVVLRYSVRDTGMGIPLSARSQLFKAFSQVSCDKPRSRQLASHVLRIPSCFSVMDEPIPSSSTPPQPVLLPRVTICSECPSRQLKLLWVPLSLLTVHLSPHPNPFSHSLSQPSHLLLPSPPPIPRPCPPLVPVRRTTLPAVALAARASAWPSASCW